jgi:glycosyltransferase involved in cell wall biosynthesis
LPNISVIIPTYNRAPLLESAILSVLAQTYRAHEIIVVDDGSTDNTVEVVIEGQRKAALKQVPLRLVRQQQGGAARARNAGMAASTGDWIAFLDSDDRWLPEKLECQVNAVTETHASSCACVTDASFVNNSELGKSAFQYAGYDTNDESTVMDAATKRIVYGYHGFYLQTLLVKKREATELGGFDPNFRTCEDADFFLRLSLKTSIVRVNRILVAIDRTPDREIGLIEIGRNEAKSFETQKRLYDKWLVQQPGLEIRDKKLVHKRLQEIHCGISSLLLLENRYAEARQSLKTALSYYWTGKVMTKWFLASIAPALAKALVIRQRSARPVEPLL